MSTNRTCSIDGCENPFYAKHRCRPHYRLLLRANATIRRCSIEGCEGIHQGHGYCNIHYQRWLHYGDPLHPGVKDYRPWIERFMSRVEITDGCWVWTGILNESGYGHFSSPDPKGRSSVGAHRLSYVIHRGPIGPDQHVCHTCDNRRCVNPAHLFLGSYLDNINDMVAKKRHTHHESHPKAKLTLAQVKDIRSRYTYRGPHNTVTMAHEYGVTPATIRTIVNHQHWRDID